METLALRYVLDTHAALWAVADDPRLGQDARASFERTNPKEFALPDISLLEIALLVDKDRLQIAEPLTAFLNKLVNLFQVVPINPAIAAYAVSVDLPQSDPFDRVIVATAAHLDLPLLTRDRHITASGAVKTAW